MQVNPLQRRSPAQDVLPENLADNPRLSEHDKIAEASRQFESVLLRQILESSTKTVIQSKLADNSTAAGIYHDMVTTQLADSISKSGAFGLAQTFEQQLNRPSASDSQAGSGETPPALSSRESHSEADHFSRPS
jgi:Rod binding domain-containing protein